MSQIPEHVAHANPNNASDHKEGSDEAEDCTLSQLAEEKKSKKKRKSTNSDTRRPADFLKGRGARRSLTRTIRILIHRHPVPPRRNANQRRKN